MKPKTEEEIKNIRKSGKILSSVLRKIEEEITSVVHEIQFAHVPISKEIEAHVHGHETETIVRVGC